MSILLDRVDEERIKLDLTGAGLELSKAWNKMLEKVKKAKGEKNLHNEMLTVDECREYYSDTVKFPDDYPNLEDLRKIGLIERK